MMYSFQSLFSGFFLRAGLNPFKWASQAGCAGGKDLEAGVQSMLLWIMSQT